MVSCPSCTGGQRGPMATGSRPLQQFWMLICNAQVWLKDLVSDPVHHCFQAWKDHGNPEVAADLSIVQKFVKLMINIAGNRCWSQMFLTMCLPYSMASIFSLSELQCRKASSKWKMVAKVWLKLEDFCLGNPRNSAAAMLLEDIALNRLQLTRQFMVRGLAIDWDFRDEELRSLAFAVFATPATTRDALESAFAWLRDCSMRQAKNRKMSPYTKYASLLMCPYALAGGIQQVRAFAEDYTALRTSGFQDSEVMQLNPFKPLKTPLGKEFPTTAEIRDKWKPAGFQSNRVASAATALCLQQAPHDFSQIDKAWSGDSSILCSSFSTNNIYLFIYIYMLSSPGMFSPMPNHEDVFAIMRRPKQVWEYCFSCSSPAAAIFFGPEESSSWKASTSTTRTVTRTRCLWGLWSTQLWGCVQSLLSQRTDKFLGLFQ